MKIQAQVFVLYTGGTIGMEQKEFTKNGITGLSRYALTPAPVSNILSYMPESIFQTNRKKMQQLLYLENGNEIHITYATLEKYIDSANMNPSQWEVIAKIIEKIYDNYDGFVVLHGTDTMAYTASALSFIFENLAKPIIITGSQLPIANHRSDALGNIIHSLYVAAYKATQLPRIPEVCIVFADAIMRGCRAKKISSDSFSCFVSPNFPLLGKIGSSIHIDDRYILPTPTQPLVLHYAFSCQISVVTMYPGIDASYIDKIICDPSVKGIIICTYGTGNIPTNSNILHVLCKAIQKGKIILNITQCHIGSVCADIYATGMHIEEKVIQGKDITLESAVTKMMWVLANFQGKEIYTQLQNNIRGEQNS